MGCLFHAPMLLKTHVADLCHHQIDVPILPIRITRLASFRTLRIPSSHSQDEAVHALHHHVKVAGQVIGLIVSLGYDLLPDG